MAHLAIGAVEVVTRAPQAWGALRNVFKGAKSKLTSIKAAMNDASLEEVRGQVSELAGELETVIDSLESAINRVEQLEGELEADRHNAIHNRQVFEAVWEWSQQGWLKRTFSSPKLPARHLWRETP